MAGELETDDLQDPFQHKPFYDSRSLKELIVGQSVQVLSAFAFINLFNLMGYLYFLLVVNRGHKRRCKILLN